MTRPDPVKGVLAVVAGAFGSLDTSLNIAFPDLVADFDLAVGDLQWVVVCYVLAYGALLLGAGQLGDVIGHRRVLGFGAGLSTVALVVCASANTFGLLLVGRVVQGIGVSMVMASAPAMLTTSAPGGPAGPPGRGRAVGVFQTSAAVGLAIGPIVGGPLVDLAGWRGVFWFRIPIALVLLAFSLRVNPSDVRVVGAARGDRRGAALAAATLGAAVFCFNRGGVLGFTHPTVVASAAIAIGFGWAFVASSRRADTPLLDLDLFRSRSFALRFANLMAVVANGAMFATWLLIPSLLIDRIGTSLFVGGLVLAASPVLTAVLSPIAGRISDRRGARAIAATGLAVEALGMFALSRADSSWSPWAVAAAIAVVGAGLGLFTVPNMSVVMGRLPDDKQGVAGGLSLMTRTLGIVAGVAIASVVFDAIEPDRGFSAAFSTVFVASAATLAAAAVLAALPTPD